MFLIGSEGSSSHCLVGCSLNSYFIIFREARRKITVGILNWSYPKKRHGPLQVPGSTTEVMCSEGEILLHVQQMASQAN